MGAYSVLQSAELYDWDQNSWTATGEPVSANLLLSLKTVDRSLNQPSNSSRTTEVFFEESGT